MRIIIRKAYGESRGVALVSNHTTSHVLWENVHVCLGSSKNIWLGTCQTNCLFRGNKVVPKAVEISRSETSTINEVSHLNTTLLLFNWRNAGSVSGSFCCPALQPIFQFFSFFAGQNLRPSSSYISDPRCPMISTSSLVLDGLGPAGPHHMGFGEHYMRSKMPSVPSEFLRPLPKPAPLVPRYNGRPAPSQSPRKDYMPPSSTGPPVSGPVNLAKDANEGTYYTSRIFHPGFFPPPYGGLYASPYSSMLTRPTYIPSTPLSPMDTQYPSTQTSPNNPAFRSPGGYSPQPPPPMPPATSTSSSISQVTTKSQPSVAQKRPFKVPPGRETKAKLIPQRVKRQNLNNNTLPPNFTKGSLIRLGNGELRRVEDVTMADLESSAEQCPSFRLDPSTVVRIEESANGLVLLTLSHGENKRTVCWGIFFACYLFNLALHWGSIRQEKSVSRVHLPNSAPWSAAKGQNVYDEQISLVVCLLSTICEWILRKSLRDLRFGPWFNFDSLWKQSTVGSSVDAVDPASNSFTVTFSYAQQNVLYKKNSQSFESIAIIKTTHMMAWKITVACANFDLMWLLWHIWH